MFFSEQHQTTHTTKTRSETSHKISLMELKDSHQVVNKYFQQERGYVFDDHYNLPNNA
jgi:DNA-binding protein Fis